MGEIAVLCEQGDIKVEWDPNDSESCEKAAAEFKRLAGDGYEFFEVQETPNKQKRVKSFRKNLGKVIASPGVQKPADKAAGTRPKAQAGGPNTTGALLPGGSVWARRSRFGTP